MKRVFSPKTKKVIFFDLNHTLIDQKQSFRNCFVDVLHEFTGRWDANTREWNAQEIVKIYEKKWNQLKKTKRKTKLSRRKRQLQCLREALKTLPVIVNQEFARTFFHRIHQLQTEHTLLYPNTIKVLTELKKKYKLAIITNQPHVHLHKLGLSQIFSEHDIISPVNKNKKPHPNIFNRAMKMMKVKPEEAVMVGNSWSQDILGATRCGMDAVWIQRTHKKNCTRKLGLRRVVIIRQLQDLLGVF